MEEKLKNFRKNKFSYFAIFVFLGEIFLVLLIILSSIFFYFYEDVYYSIFALSLIFISFLGAIGLACTIMAYLKKEKQKRIGLILFIINLLILIIMILLGVYNAKKKAVIVYDAFNDRELKIKNIKEESEIMTQKINRMNNMRNFDQTNNKKIEKNDDEKKIYYKDILLKAKRKLNANKEVKEFEIIENNLFIKTLDLLNTGKKQVLVLIGYDFSNHNFIDKSYIGVFELNNQGWEEIYSKVGKPDFQITKFNKFRDFNGDGAIDIAIHNWGGSGGTGYDLWLNNLAKNNDLIRVENFMDITNPCYNKNQKLVKGYHNLGTSSAVYFEYKWKNSSELNKNKVIEIDRDWDIEKGEEKFINKYYKIKENNENEILEKEEETQRMYILDDEKCELVFRE